MPEKKNRPAISILLPTRNRVSKVLRLLDSISHTTSVRNAVEVIIYADDDDGPSREISFDEIPIKRISAARNRAMGAIYTDCFHASTGRYLMLMNDDVVFRTRGWDERVRQAMAEFNDDMAFVYGNDLDQGGSVPSFPVFPRKVIEVMGGIPSGYRNYHIESHVFDIFKRVRAAGHDRITYLEDVVFEHMHYMLGKSEFDSTYIKEDVEADCRLFIELDEERDYVARRIVRHIERLKCSGDKQDAPGAPIAVSVLMEFSGGMERLHTALAAITGPELPGSQEKNEITVLDCSPGTQLLSLAEALRGVDVIEVDARLTRSSAHLNTAARNARGDYLLFMRQGVVPAPGLLPAMLAAARRHPDAGVVGCKHVDPRSMQVLHAGLCFYASGGRLCATRLYSGLDRDAGPVNKPRELQAIDDSCMLVDKEAFLRAGGFDGSCGFLRGIGLCLKIRKAGGKVVYDNAPVVFIGEAGREGTTGPEIPAEWHDMIECDLERVLEEDALLLRSVEGRDHFKYEVVRA